SRPSRERGSCSAASSCRCGRAEPRLERAPPRRSRGTKRSSSRERIPLGQREISLTQRLGARWHGSCDAIEPENDLVPARAMWKGRIRLDGFELPVKLYSAATDRAVHFRLLHAPDRVPLELRIVAPATNQPVGHHETP